MRIFYFILFSLVIAAQSSAQPWLYDLAKQKGNETFSFSEQTDAFNLYWKNHSYQKGKGFMAFGRWQNYIKTRLDKNGNYRPDIIWDEYQKIKNQKSLAGNWTYIGAVNTPLDINGSGRSGSGRINAVAFHPSNPSIIYCGAPAGGFWRSSNGGLSWETTTDNLPSIGVSAISIRPDNPNIIFIGTGDADASDTYSCGLLKSIDGGDTWQTTGYTPFISQKQTIGKIIIRPDHPDTMYLATSAGVKKSFNGGVTITQAKPGNFRDIEFKPGNPDVFYASTYSNSGAAKIYKTINGGTSFTDITPPTNVSQVSRIAIAVSPNSPSTLYSLSSNKYDNGFHSLCRSDDDGVTWDEVYNQQYSNLLGWDSNGGDAGGQGWYDLALEVSPIDEFEVYVGGVNVWKSNDGGFSWQIVGHWYGDQADYVHADQHILAFNPLNNNLYAGNDGGIYKTSNNGGSWTDLSDGLEILQIYRIGQSNTDVNRIIAGCQDNGSMLRNPTNWKSVLGGDGMDCMIDFTNANKLYGEYYYGSLYRSDNGGYSWNDIKPNQSMDGAWVTPLAMHPTNPAILYAGYEDVYKSTNSGNSWNAISSNLVGPTTIDILAVAPSDPNVIFAGTLYQLLKTNNAGSTWTNITSVDFSGSLNRVAISNTNPNKVWAVYGGFDATVKVFMNDDGSHNWLSLTDGLPNVPINCIVYENNSPERIYIGTDVGVFVHDTIINSWVSFNNNLPVVVVTDLEIHYPTGKLRASTYGRGVWESDLYTGTSSVAPKELNYSELKIYPNPTNGISKLVYQSLNLGRIKISVFSVDGKQVYCKQIEHSGNLTELILDMSYLSKGFYTLQLSSDKEIKTSKICIE